MKFSVSSNILILMVVLFLFASNPTREAHQDAIRAKLKEQYNFAKIPGVPTLYTAGLEYHDCLLFSFETHEGELISLGLATRVFVREMKAAEG